MSDLTYSIAVMENTNFGDHGAIVPVSRESIPGETVEDLIRRCHPNLGAKYVQHDPVDHIILRVTAESAERMKAESAASDPVFP